jgi:hypothetical protein
MDSLVVGLLGMVGFVLGLAFALFAIYRHHLRRLRRANRQQDPLSQSTSARRRALPFQLPARWLAIRSTNTPILREALGIQRQAAVPWSDALARGRERSFFVSAPVDGWSLVVGARLPDAMQDVDALYRFLTRLSREVGEVHYYSADRVLNYHTWARLDDGRVLRAYSWAAETLWNEGRPTIEERLLGLRCWAYGEDPEPGRYGDAPPELHNTERVILLARRWSVDPVAASEILLSQETVESGNDGEPAD